MSINCHDFKKQMAKSFIFHLFAPYIVQLGLVFLLVQQMPLGVLWGTMVHLGAFVLLLSILFGVCHVYQTICIAPGWRSAGRQFLVGLMNPSLAILTIAGVFFLNPEINLELRKISATPGRHDAIKWVHPSTVVFGYSLHSVVLIFARTIQNPSNDPDLV